MLDRIPEYGLTQPKNGICFPLAFRLMGRPKKPATQGDALSGLISENLEARLSIHFPLSKYGTETKQLMALAKRSGVGKETIRRMLRREGYPQVDSLEAVAKALGASAAEFLRPPIVTEEAPDTKRTSHRTAP